MNTSDSSFNEQSKRTTFHRLHNILDQQTITRQSHQLAQVNRINRHQRVIHQTQQQQHIHQFQHQQIHLIHQFPTHHKSHTSIQILKSI